MTEPMTEPKTGPKTGPIIGPITGQSTEGRGGGAGSRTPEQVARLFAIAAGEREGIARLTGCVADLNAAQAAKQKLASLSAAEAGDALEHRRKSLREAQ